MRILNAPKIRTLCPPNTTLRESQYCNNVMSDVLMITSYQSSNPEAGRHPLFIKCDLCLITLDAQRQIWEINFLRKRLQKKELSYTTLLINIINEHECKLRVSPSRRKSLQCRSATAEATHNQFLCSALHLAILAIRRLKSCKYSLEMLYCKSTLKIG